MHCCAEEQSSLFLILLVTHFEFVHFIARCIQVCDFKQESGRVVLGAKHVAAAGRRIQSVKVSAAKLARRHNLSVEFDLLLDFSGSVRMTH
jgi:hypothetical protein